MLSSDALLHILHHSNVFYIAKPVTYATRVRRSSRTTAIYHVRPHGSDLDGFNGFHDDRDDYDEYDSASVDYNRTSSRTSNFDWGRRGSA